MPDSNSTAKAIRGLTVAVWALAIITLVELLFSTWALVFPEVINRHLANSMPSVAPGSSSQSIVSEEYEGFGDWPVDKQIEAASVIALARFEKSGTHYKCLISEILKQRHGTVFYYKVGDGFPLGDMEASANTSYGDGQVLFFTGASATFRFSATYSNGRVGAMGDMPLETLKAEIQKTNH